MKVRQKKTHNVFDFCYLAIDKTKYSDENATKAQMIKQGTTIVNLLS